jgi:hypothetical protein
MENGKAMELKLHKLENTKETFSIIYTTVKEFLPIIMVINPWETILTVLGTVMEKFSIQIKINTRVTF